MHGGFRGAQGQLVFRVAGAALSPGDRVTITYGDTSGGGGGLEMPDFNSELMPFPLYLDLDGSNLWLSIPLHGVPVVGSTVATVNGFAPSIVTRAKSLNCRCAPRMSLATGPRCDSRLADRRRSGNPSRTSLPMVRPCSE